MCDVTLGPGLQCSWLQLAKVGAKWLETSGPPLPAHTQHTDTNQVMKNRSAMAIIQSSSLIRFLDPVICEPGLKPCPCVSWERETWELGVTFFSHSAPSVLPSALPERAIKPKHPHHFYPVLSRSEITTSTASIYKEINNFNFYPFFITAGAFLVVVTTAITLLEF